MINRSKTELDAVELMIRAIGRDQLVSYFEARLRQPKNIPTRPQLLTAYSQVAGITSLKLLIAVLNNKKESPNSRIAAIRAIGIVAHRQDQDLPANYLIDILHPFLSNQDLYLRSAAASALVALNAHSSATQLQELVQAGKLDTPATDEVRRFIKTSFANVPLSWIPHVEGYTVRKHELESLHQAFHEARVVQLIGEAGSGKTYLAARYALEAEYDLKLWVSAPHMHKSSPRYTELLHQLSLQLSDDIQLPTDVPASLGEVLSLLITELYERKVLIVVQDLDSFVVQDQAEFKNAILSMTRSNHTDRHCLLTNRRPVDLPDSLKLVLGELNQEQAADLLRHIMEGRGLQITNRQIEYATKLLSALPTTPLFIRLIADHIVEGGKEWEHPSIPTSITAILDIEYSRLEPAHRRFLEILAQFDTGESVDSALLRDILRRENILSSTQESWLDDRVLSRFVTQSNGQLWFSHMIYQDYIREHTDARTVLRVNMLISEYYRTKKDFVSAAISMLRTTIRDHAIELVHGYLDEIIARGEAARVLNMLQDAAVGRDNTKIRILRLAGLARLSEATSSYEQALEYCDELLMILRNEDHGSHSSDYQIALVNVGRIYHRLGDYQRARSVFERIYDEASKDSNTRAATLALNGLGEIHLMRQEYEEALGYFLRSFDLGHLLGHLGGNISNAHVGANVALAYQRLGDFVSAESYYRWSTIALWVEGQGNEKSPDNAYVYSNFASLYTGLGNFEQAREYLDRSLSIAEDINDPANIALALQILGELYTAEGVSVPARTCFERALSLRRELFGHQIETADTITSLGILDLIGGNSRDALNHFKRAYEIYEQYLEATSIKTERLGSIIRAWEALAVPITTEERNPQLSDLNARLRDLAVQGLVGTNKSTITSLVLEFLLGSLSFFKGDVFRSVLLRPDPEDSDYLHLWVAPYQGVKSRRLHWSSVGSNSEKLSRNGVLDATFRDGEMRIAHLIKHDNTTKLDVSIIRYQPKENRWGATADPTVYPDLVFNNRRHQYESFISVPVSDLSTGERWAVLAFDGRHANTFHTQSDYKTLFALAASLAQVIYLHTQLSTMVQPRTHLAK
jgi:tetratricopeptide (TPR) repeat protein